MKKHQYLKKDVFTKKMIIISSKLLVLFLIFGLLISFAYAASSENIISSGVQKGTSDPTGASLKPGMGLLATPVDLCHLSAISSIGIVSAPVSFDLRNLEK